MDLKQIEETISPKQYFVVDGLGALVSAFMLGVVLVSFESFFGIPKQALYILAALPCFFTLYDLFCYLRVEKNLGRYLRIIAMVNIAYCCLSLGFAFYHFNSLTIWGWSYIIGEIIIVIALSIIEIRVANKS